MLRDTLVVLLSESLSVTEAGTTPALQVVPQTTSRQAVVDVDEDEEIALIEGETNTPIALGKTDLAVMALETTTVL